MNSTSKGDVAVLLAAAKLVESGLIILKPISESLPFDLVILYDNMSYKIQVKRAQIQNNGRWAIPFRKMKPTIIDSATGQKKYMSYTYTAQHADFICGVVIETNDVYVFPLKEVKNTSHTIVDPNKTARIETGFKHEKYRNRIILDGKEFKL
jgi:hypothetical protein